MIQTISIEVIKIIKMVNLIFYSRCQFRQTSPCIWSYFQALTNTNHNKYQITIVSALSFLQLTRLIRVRSVHLVQLLKGLTLSIPSPDSHIPVRPLHNFHALVSINVLFLLFWTFMMPLALPFNQKISIEIFYWILHCKFLGF